jgi:hypothetical protein
MTAFLSKPGFKPVKHLTGAPYTGQANMYVVGPAVTLVPGDVVILDGTGHSSGVPTCTIATAAAAPLGVVVGVVNTKLDPVTGEMSTGSILLDTPQTAIQGSFVMVADAPDLVCETEQATYVQADVGRNAQMVVTTYNTTTGASNMKSGASTATATDPLKLLGRVLRMDGTATGTYTDAADGDTNVKILVAFNTHIYKATTGTAVV